MENKTLHPDILRYRLYCAIPNPEDGCSYYRGLGPLARMARLDPRLDLVGPFLARTAKGWNLGWDAIAYCDAVFLQRPFLDVHVQFCKQCKAMGIAVWIDWDDLLWDVPRSNPAWSAYHDQEAIRNNVKEMFELADVVTTATRPLAETLGAKTIIIPNASHVRPQTYEPRKRMVAWRGSESHEADVTTVLSELHDLSRMPQYCNWKWHFSGGVPYQVRETVLNFEESPGTGPIFFVPFFSVLAPYLLIVPLRNCFFNHCKSNLAWIEGTAAGAVTLAPDWIEWKRPGLVTYKDAKDFRDKMRWLMDDYRPGEVHTNVKDSAAYIDSTLTLDHINTQRFSVLNTLYGY